MKASKAIVRSTVREICNMAPGHGKTEAMLLKFARDLLGAGSVDLQMVRDALEWNLSENFVRYIDASETESGETEWHITSAGQARERIK
jgi:hypothetical protein